MGQRGSIWDKWVRFGRAAVTLADVQGCSEDAAHVFQLEQIGHDVGIEFLKGVDVVLGGGPVRGGKRLNVPAREFDNHEPEGRSDGFHCWTLTAHDCMMNVVKEATE